jgi:hypothetical protein
LPPPVKPFSTYPSSTLQHYYPGGPSVPFQAHITGMPLQFSHNTMPLPSASQSHVPSLRQSPSLSVSPTARLTASIEHHDPHVTRFCSPLLSPIQFIPSLPLPSNENCRSLNHSVPPLPFTSIENRRSPLHHVFSPPYSSIENRRSPLPHPQFIPLHGPLHAPNPAPAPQPPLFYPSPPTSASPLPSPLLPPLPGVPRALPASPLIRHVSPVSSLHINSTVPTNIPFKITLPSTKDIPILTGRHDWGPWHTAVRTLIDCSNLLGHVHDNMLPGARYDPDLEPTFPPLITWESSDQEKAAYSEWWNLDKVAAYILTSRLSPSVLGSVLLQFSLIYRSLIT